jgi:NAD(P) transhydrogenase
MVANMPRGGVTVDLAAEAGGNVTTTRPGEAYVTDNGITCIGYTNMPSRMGTTSSNLFSGNVSKFLLSMNKEGEDDKPDMWHIDTENDEAVRSICIVHKGKGLDPYVPPPPVVKDTVAVVEEPEPDPKALTSASAKNYTIGAVTAAALGANIPNAPMLSTFALSVWVGSSAVAGVTHALHSPLMAMTNAISGMTILGGMLQLDGGLMPGEGGQVVSVEFCCRVQCCATRCIVVLFLFVRCLFVVLSLCYRCFIVVLSLFYRFFIVFYRCFIVVLSLLRNVNGLPPGCFVALFAAGTYSNAM